MARIVCSIAGAVVVVSSVMMFSARAEELLPPDIAFAQSYCNVSWESAITVIPTTDGMTIAVNGARQEGSSETFTFVNYLAEALPDGTPVNQYPFAEGLYPASGCAVTGGYVFAAASDQVSKVLVGVNHQGVEQWRQAYNNLSSGDRFSQLIVLRDGNLLALGDTGTADEPYETGVLVQKTDAVGNLLWAGNFLQAPEVRQIDLAEVPATAGGAPGCYVLAHSRILGGPVLLRLDDNGDVVWQTVLISPDWRYDFRSLAVAPDGLVLAGGAIRLPDARYFDVCLVQVDFDGTIVWQREYDYHPSYNEIALKILGLPDGGFVLYCMRSGFTFALVRTDAQGEVLWEHGYTVLDGMGHPRSIALAYDGGVLMAYTMSIGTPVTDSDALVVKTTPIVPPITTMFRRGDSNGDGVIDLSDAVNTLSMLFLGTGNVACQDAADSNDDGFVDLSDAVCVLTCLFLGSPPALMPPYPGSGIDPTDDSLGCDQYGS